MTCLVLVHSPLMRQLTWQPVADALSRSDAETLAPFAGNAEDDSTMFWQQHAEGIARAVVVEIGDEPVVLVGHSGAGPLLPAIREALGSRVAGYVFVDAGLPVDGRSYLDEIRRSQPELAAALCADLQAGGRYPNWRDEDLRRVVPDDELRARIVADIHPRPLAFFEQPIRVFEGWPDAPCGYVLLSPAYRDAVAEARGNGWPLRELQASHFHMLVRPAEVAAALLDVVHAMGVSL